jgi:molybdate transport system substrate-binding protein
MRPSLLLLALLALFAAVPAQAGKAHVAVAANFTKLAEELAPVFHTQTGHEVIYSFGATGQLYAQISQGAPFDVFLAADAERPEKAVADGFGVENSRFTYAIGVLALFSTVLNLDDGKAILEGGGYIRLAIADPKAAPYGRAALESLDALGLAEVMRDRLVTGESISQALQFVQTGNAELGFVAASQVVGQDNVWLVPRELYAPIVQDAVLLKRGEGNAAAEAFVEFLKSDVARGMIRASGYAVP